MFWFVFLSFSLCIVVIFYLICGKSLGFTIFLVGFVNAVFSFALIFSLNNYIWKKRRKLGGNEQKLKQIQLQFYESFVYSSFSNIINSIKWKKYYVVSCSNLKTVSKSFLSDHHFHLLIFYRKGHNLRKQFYMVLKQPLVVFNKRAVLKNFAIFTGKRKSWSLYLIKLQVWRASKKKRLQYRCFLVNIARFLRIPILKNICEQLLLIVERPTKFYSLIL